MLYLTTLSITDMPFIIHHHRSIFMYSHEYGTLMKWCWQGKAEVLEEEPVPVSGREHLVPWLRMTGAKRLHFFLWRWDPTRVMASSFLRFLDHTQQRTTVGRTPLDEWSARRRDLYLTTHNIHKPNIHAPVGFEPMISAGERPQTHALDRAAIATCYHYTLVDTY